MIFNLNMHNFKRIMIVARTLVLGELCSGSVQHLYLLNCFKNLVYSYIFPWKNMNVNSMSY